MHEKKVLKLTDLLSTYIQALEDTEFHNPDYRSEKLKNKLENRFGDEVAFCKLVVKGKYVSQLIYSATQSWK